MNHFWWFLQDRIERLDNEVTQAQNTGIVPRLTPEKETEMIYKVSAWMEEIVEIRIIAEH